MSELQTALLAIGCGVVVVVYVFGWWQQRQYRRKFGATFKGDHADALYRESGDEPFGQVQPSLPNAVADEMPAETSADGQVVEAAITPVTNLLDESCALLDARSDFIIELHLDEAAPAAVLDGLWQRKFDFGKPVQVCGLSLNGARWERAIAEGQTLYSRFRIALQLVDRGGVVSMAKLTDFRDLVQGVAKHIKADTTIPDPQATHQCALDLDAFCAEVDQMAGINMVPPGERLLAGSRIAQAAALQGMMLESDGAFHLPDAHGRSLFTLINMDTRPFQRHTLEAASSKGLTLLLDVPRVERPAEQFGFMVKVAREFAKELQVNLVDDHRVVLSDEGLARIREKIAEVETKMVESTIEPGSAQARRLFS
jgi:FtsZ-interacting cell division protein ZipA